MPRAISTICLAFFLGCNSSNAGTQAAPAPETHQASAVFAGGCFWCLEKDFEKLEGVTSAVSGYSGGKLQNPTYAQVSSHSTQHLEVVQVNYDPALVSYAELLDYFWHHIDPLDSEGQFCDKGHQYTSAIFVSTESERQAALSSKESTRKALGEPIATVIRDAAPFWEAEGYHQDYYKKNPWRYNAYRASCGRDKRVRQIWGAPKH